MRFHPGLDSNGLDLIARLALAEGVTLYAVQEFPDGCLGALKRAGSLGAELNQGLLALFLADSLRKCPLDHREQAELSSLAASQQATKELRHPDAREPVPHV